MGTATIIIRNTATSMTEANANLLRLMSWLSPAFPVGAFAYSHGLERAIHDGQIRDRQGLLDWVTDLLGHGSGWNDAVLLAETWRQASSGSDCAPAAELTEAMAGSRERHMETTLQGAAFGEAVAAWPIEMCQRQRSTSPSDSLAAIPYPIAVAMAAAQHGVLLEETLTAYLHAFASNLIQAAARLVPLGQRDGVAALVALEPVILAAASRAAGSTLNDLGSCTVLSDIASMKHETQYSRVFRS
jgi:urease accessory protein